MKKILLILFLLVLNACNKDENETIPVNYNNYENWDEWQLLIDDGISLFVRDFGKGDTVIVLHGGWGHQHIGLISAFTNIANQYHFVFYDQRGSLRSRCPDTLISVVKHIEDVEQLRKELGLEKMVLVCHSMGGFLGMSYLEKYPENVKGMILIASSSAISFDRTGINETALNRWKREDVLDTLNAHNLKVEDWGTYNNKQSGTLHRITSAAINMHSVKNWRKLRGAFYWNQEAAIVAGLTMPKEWDFTEILKNVNIPITVIHGDDDYLPLSWHKEWTSTVPNAELKIIENAGHVPWICQPEVFKKYILYALDKILN